MTAADLADLEDGGVYAVSELPPAVQLIARRQLADDRERDDWRHRR